jgi:hypothetical protein
LWRDRQGEWTAELQHRIFDENLLHRSVIVRGAKGTDRLVIDYWGGNRVLLGKRWMELAVGKEVEDQPFPDLGKWIASTYHEALNTQEPLLHEVDLVVPVDGATMMRRQYGRLVIPWHSPDGDRYATCVNFIRQTASTG